MTRLKTPLISFRARGSLGPGLSFRESASGPVAEKKPIPAQPHSWPQTYQRWLYQDYAYLWTQQTQAVKDVYRGAGSRFHLTGYQYWMKYQLTNLPDIVSMLHLDKTRGAIAYDASRAGNDGTIIGCTPTTGVIAGGLHYDGVNDLVSLGRLPALEGVAAEWTIELFVKIAGNFTRNTLFAYDAIDTLGTYDLYAYWYKGFQLQYQLGGGQGEKSSSITSWDDHLWHHFAMVKTATRCIIYGDGVETNNVVFAGSDFTPAYVFKLGDNYNIQHMWGNHDHLIIRNRTSDPTEILRHSKRRWILS